MDKTNIKVIDTQQPPLPKVYLDRGLDASTVSVLKKLIFPSARNDETIALAYDYCKARGLDIMKRVVHIVSYGDQEQILPGIAEYRITAARTERYAGKAAPVFGPDVTKTWTYEAFVNNKKVTKEVTITFPEYCEVAVYKIVAGTKCEFVERVYWIEAVATYKGGCPNTMWQKRVKGQLAKCAEAASLRAAFPEELGATPTAEEMEGKDPNVIDPISVSVTTEAKVSKFAEANLKESGVVTDVQEEDKTDSEPPTSEEERMWVFTTPDAIELSVAHLGQEECIEKALELLDSTPSKEKRLEFMQNNMWFIRELLRKGRMDAVTNLHKKVDEGK